MHAHEASAQASEFINYARLGGNAQVGKAALGYSSEFDILVFQRFDNLLQIDAFELFFNFPFQLSLQFTIEIELVLGVEQRLLLFFFQFI